MFVRLSARLLIGIIIILMIVPASAQTLYNAEGGRIFFIRDSPPAEQIIIIYAIETNETLPRIKIRDPHLSLIPERRLPSTHVRPVGLTARPHIPDMGGERTVRIYHIQSRDPYLHLKVSILRMKVHLNPSLYPPINIYQVSTIPGQPYSVDDLEWRFLDGGDTDYFTIAIPGGKERIWIDLFYKEGPLVLTAYSPDAVLGPFNDEQDGMIDNRIYLEIAGDTIIPEGEWYFRIENTGDKESQFTFTIWY